MFCTGCCIHVSSLFPAEIRDRLFQQQNEGGAKTSKRDGKVGSDAIANKYRLKTYLNEEDSKIQEDGDNENMAETDAKADMYDSKPIADLFPNTTVRSYHSVFCFYFVRFPPSNSPFLC